MYDDDLENDDFEEEPGLDFSEPEEDAIDEPTPELKSEGEMLDSIYPSMSGDKKGNIDPVPEEMRNQLDPDHEQNREGIIRQRIEDMQQDARGHFKDWEISILSEALRKQLENQNIDTLLGYSRKRQSDYDSLKFKIDTVLGRGIKTKSGETEEQKMDREYPSMRDERKSFRRALGLGE